MGTELLLAGRGDAQQDVDLDTKAALVQGPYQAPQVDVASDTIIYVGKAAVGQATSAATWQIFRMTISATGSITTEYADGDAEFDNIWDDRATLSYSFT